MTVKEKEEDDPDFCFFICNKARKKGSDALGTGEETPYFFT